MDDGGGPRISVAAGITVGLIASFVQSLGLTLQRRSHLQNEALEPRERKSDWHRPNWIIGFAIYFTSNILGSIFQIGALPLVILGPLGAVSLLWNAILARFLLGDFFSSFLVIGTVLIAGGAVLIGYFGAVPEPAHPLEYLITLYSRPAFVAEFTILCAATAAVCAAAHLAEWRLERRLREEFEMLERAEEGSRELGSEPFKSLRGERKRRSMWRRKRPRALSLPMNNRIAAPKSSSIVPPPTAPPVSQPTTPFTPPKKSAKRLREKARAYRPSPRVIARTRLLVGVAYGSASGTLSGICLLFAKTGVELLILTIVGVENEFVRWQTWVIVGALISAAVLQLWYLNKALRLVGPTLICPLAFCFYNLSSILNGLVYYDQVKLLSDLQIGLVVLGTCILLCGVWVVSIRSGQPARAEAGEGTEEEIEPLLTDMGVPEPEVASAEVMLTTSPLEGGFQKGVVFQDQLAEVDPSEWGETTDGGEWTDEQKQRAQFRRTVANIYKMFVNDDAQRVRGFSIGLGAASPGFAIRPAGRRQASISGPPGSTSSRASGSIDVASVGPRSPPMSDSLPALPVTSPPSPPNTLDHHRSRKTLQLDRRVSAPAGRPDFALSMPSGSERPQHIRSISGSRPRRLSRELMGSLTGDPYVGIGESGKGEDLWGEGPEPLVKERPGEESLLVHAQEALEESSPGSSDNEETARQAAERQRKPKNRWRWFQRGKGKGKDVESTG